MYRDANTPARRGANTPARRGAIALTCHDINTLTHHKHTNPSLSTSPAHNLNSPFLSSNQSRCVADHIKINSFTSRSNQTKMNFSAPNRRQIIIELAIPLWYPLQNAVDVYLFFLRYPYTRWILFQRINQLRSQSNDIIIVTHPLISFPFQFYPGSSDAGFVDALIGRIRRPSNEDLYPA